ncbi:MAG TPA: LPS export ABC transporter periplasmic protein LptC [Firmicutes bacterium]|jgi:hypothetical protein|nr:LPS export ABC transporter periplasmic protein LptC [Bacillota bacterium]
MATGKRRLGTFLAVVSLLGAIILFYLSLRPIPIPVSEAEPTERGVTFLDGRYEGWEGNKRSWFLEAAEIFRPAEGQKVTFRAINQLCYFQEDGPDLVLTAGSATLDLKRDRLTLVGVDGEVGGGKLSTEEIEFDLEKKLVKCSPPLSFTKEQLKVEAERMEGNLQTGEYCFFGGLEVVQKDQRIRGESLTYYVNEDRFEIRGAVEVELTL